MLFLMWNYRVMRDRDQDGRFWFAIYEVYYTDGVPDSWTAKPSRPQGDTFEELTQDFALYSEALKKPVLAIEAGGDELYELGSETKLVWSRNG